MEAKIEQQQEHIRQLEQEVREKEQRASNVDKAAELVEKLKEQINIQVLIDSFLRKAFSIEISRMFA
ncbi:unnamed protein product [Nippostrongylus brasiliensis]|uniref:Uncharacterized protein n=1 Tax=Nippostrongylus brasiliensis TaxID=27835 RepID=A0A0N4XSH9_NIPBR|nr:unnamed protein product [Nippostrongylus brasiliensis]